MTTSLELARRRAPRAPRLAPALALMFGFGDLAAQSAPAIPEATCTQVGAAPLTAGSGILDLARLVEVTRASDGVAVGHMHMARRSDTIFESGCAGSGNPEVGNRIGPVTWRLLPVTAGTWLNTGYAEDRDNGLVWAGRGFSSALALGIAARLGPLSAGFIPEIAWQQNREFEIAPRTLPGYSPYVHAHYAEIDLPQRFGPASFASADPWGQSFVRLDRWGLAAGYAHESLRIGPAVRNPILLGGSAPGFHHFFIGSGRPWNIGFATLELQALVGRVHESDYFDARSENDRSELAAFSLSLRPRWLGGLEVGTANVLRYQRAAGSAWYGDADVLGAFFNPLGGDPGGNEISSLFARWVFAENDAEIYGEWTRNDDPAGLDDLIQEPDHAQGYTFGFQKWTPVGVGGVRVHGEWTALQEKGEPRPGRALVVYYTDPRVIQGHTHRGQLLGAGIGPGADAQFIGLDYTHGWGYGGVFIERVRRNDASAAAQLERQYYPYDHDAAVTAGLRGLLFRGPISIGGSLSYSRRYSREFLADTDNMQLVTEVVWWPK